MVSFCSTYSRSVRSKIASIFFGILFSIPIANSASADVNSAIDRLLSDAVTQTQSMISMMNTNCSGEAHGENPLNYGAFVDTGNQAVKTLNDLRVALAKGQPANAGQQIDSVIARLERMVGLMHENCSGGPHGVNPLRFGDLVATKQTVTGKLEAVKVILAG